jgi:hypothetical protein
MSKRVLKRIAILLDSDETNARSYCETIQKLCRPKITPSFSDIEGALQQAKETKQFNNLELAVKSTIKIHALKPVKRKTTQRKAAKWEVGQCKFCGRPAISGSDACYRCS